MENDILFMTLGYILSRFAFVLLIGYLVYRVLRGNPNQTPIQSQQRITCDLPVERRYRR